MTESTPTEPTEYERFFAQNEDGTLTQVAQYAILLTSADPRRSPAPGTPAHTGLVVFPFENGLTPDIAVLPFRTQNDEHVDVTPDSDPRQFDTANFGPYAVEVIRNLTEGPRGSKLPQTVEIVRWNKDRNRYTRLTED